MLWLDEHKRIFFEYLVHICFVVSTIDRENNAAIKKLQKRPLEFTVRVARIFMSEGNTEGPRLTNNPAPERIVEVEHQALADDTASRSYKREPLLGNKQEEFVAEWLAECV